jgi:hypothetical protein
MIDLSNSPRKSRYFDKDQAKAVQATKFIGRGSSQSSTQSYALCAGAQANCGVYHETDIVFISAEGNRTGRLTPDFAEIQRAIAARARIITDTPADRARPYNIGEREVAAWLSSHDHMETSPGIWEAAG